MYIPHQSPALAAMAQAPLAIVLMEAALSAQYMLPHHIITPHIPTLILHTPHPCIPPILGDLGLEDIQALRHT